MKSQGILTKTVSEVWPWWGLGGLEKIKWFAPFPVFQLEIFRKYGLWLEAMQFVSYFLAYSADFILCSRASSHTSSLHFSSGIVERAKRKRAWKSPHARKARGDGERGFLAWGDFHAFRSFYYPWGKMGSTRNQSFMFMHEVSTRVLCAGKHPLSFMKRHKKRETWERYFLSVKNTCHTMII